MRSIILLLLFSFNTFAQSQSVETNEDNIEERIAIFMEMSDLFYTLCFAEDGTFKENTVIFDTETSVRDTIIDCSGQQEALNEEKIAIDEFLNANPNFGCDQVSTNDPVQEQAAEIAALLEQPPSCQISQSTRECVGQLACSFSTMIMPPLALACGGPSLGCASSLLAGIGYSFKDLGCGIISLFGGSCEDENAQDEEAITSDAAIMASFQSEEDVVTFSENPGQWLVDKVSGFVTSIGESIAERFGCTRWEGTPYNSECLEPATWSCASCESRANMFCGSLGYIVGFVGIEVATGAVIGAVAGGATLVLRASANIGRSAARMFPRTVGRGGALVARLGRYGVALGLRASAGVRSTWQAIKASRPVQALSAVSDQIAERAAAIARGIGRANTLARKNYVVISSAQDIVAGAASVSTRALINAAKRFNQLSEDAFMLGFKATAQARLPGLRALENTIPHVDDLASGRFVDQNNNPITTPDEYFNYVTSGLEPAQRAQMQYRVTPDNRVVISIINDVEYNSALRYDGAPVIPDPPPIRRSSGFGSATQEVASQLIVVSGRLNIVDDADRYLSLERHGDILDNLDARGIDYADNFVIPPNQLRSLGTEEQAFLIESFLGRTLTREQGERLLNLTTAARAEDVVQFNNRRNQIIEEIMEIKGITRVEFTTASRGEYCTCNSYPNPGRDVRRGPWLLPCASAANFRTSREYGDVAALPDKTTAHGLGVCFKANIPEGAVCYHGGLGPTFSGFGGDAQIYCVNSDYQFQNFPEEVQAPDRLNISGETPDWSFSRYAPVSDDENVIRITSLGKKCQDSPGRCSGEDLRTIERLITNGTFSDIDRQRLELYHQYLSGNVYLDSQTGRLMCTAGRNSSSRPIEALTPTTCPR